MDSRSLLILACSQRKRSESDLLPALNRYDGGSYRVLRKALSGNHWREKLDILILSAKYGLIEASTPIADYDQRITSMRAKELQEQVLQVLRFYAQQYTYSEVYIDLGKDYLPALVDLKQTFPNSLVIHAQGQIGERLAGLKRWLLTIKGENDISHKYSQTSQKV